MRAPEQTSEDKSAGSSSENPRQETENPQGLTESELKELSELKARDREVRAHEAAHQAVGGQHAGAISYSYERGPDGAQYAVGGEVPIDVSPVAGDPQATIEKMRVVRAAAMAPAQPSSQDRAVAAQAMQTMLQAQVELSSGDNENANIDGGSDEVGQDRNAQDTPSRQATEAYQNVSAMQGYGFDSDSATSIFV
ncbi:MAG: hypothetical protein GYB26_10720 [Gammaproteobacteria bacterium]|uniref:SprA-related family protein n=1 Tax=Marinobacter litoralis TaxID=187981 RepID=A0A3M2RFD4_9GAMM|nr:hypothetical protein [Gammaproteobacteria bacterium]RMJ04030.1 SprA-related family protein [Marinobacter litoralis]